MNHLKNHSMAYTAMVLLFLLCLVFTGCGASVYEKIREDVTVTEV